MQKVSDLFNVYAKIRCEAMYETQQGTGPKKLTSKQMPLRLPIAYAQVKAGNNSESFLTEIRQIVYSIINQNKSLKRYTIT